MNNYSEIFNLGRLLYGAYIQERDAVVPSEYAEIVAAVDEKIGWHRKIFLVDTDFKVAEMQEDPRVLLGLSGGLDSVYFLRQLEKQYKVVAVHVSGLNKSSGKVEAEAARAVARGNEFISIPFPSVKQAFPDNPFKNQLILSYMVDIGVRRGIYRYAIGSDWTTPLSEAVTGFTITDSIEVNEMFWRGVQKHFPQAELLFIDSRIKKVERLMYLWRFDRSSLENISSCVSPLRFREHLHEINRKKYGIELMKGRCGSCYKCAMEYLILAEAGAIPKNSAFENHCWETLAQSKTAHRPDLFDPKLPKEQRIKNLLEYGS